jgi:hypothetical protein
MAQDPNAQFDQTVMELIEHSPIGAVPRTPAYQDALTRLYAAHQVYASADHKDCHVTARSLAGRPCFHANNLDALVAGQIEANTLEPNAGIFDHYVQSLSAESRVKAEKLRLTVAGRPVLHRARHDGTIIHDPLHTLFFVPGAGVHPGLPGNYLYGFVLEQGATSTGDAWAVHLHDSDDGAVLIDVSTLPEALAKLQEVLECAPFHLSELEALGFRSN